MVGTFVFNKATPVTRGEWMIQVAALISEAYCVGKKKPADTNLILIRNSINPTETNRRRH